jgi:hypothetical protein
MKYSKKMFPTEVPPQMGYGKKNMGDIPPNSTLFFGKTTQFYIFPKRNTHHDTYAEVKLLDIGK